MSYINLAEAALPEPFTKGVIAFWFRVPQASLDAAIAEYNAEDHSADAPPKQLDGVIPLVTFGQIFDAYKPKQETRDIVTTTFEIWGMVGTCVLSLDSSIDDTGGTDHWAEGDSYQLDQSYIGIDCTGSDEDNPNKVFLTVRLQTPDYPQMSGYALTTTSNHPTSVRFDQGSYVWELGDLPFQPGPLCPGILIKPCNVQGPFFGAGITLLADKPVNTTYAYVDETDIWQNSEKEHFGAVSKIEVTGDAWHHVILSFDLQGEVKAHGGPGQSLSSSVSMWCAFDDVNYTGEDLPSSRFDASGTSLGPNAILTDRAWSIFSTSAPQPDSFDFVAAVGEWGHTTYPPGPPPLYSYQPPGISGSGQSFGIPASAEMVDHIKRVEMAEFQMFTGVTIDTGSVSVRRYFVGDDGKPIPPDQKGNPKTGRSSGSIEGLKQKPDILLHGSGNWIKGKNTGSSGVDYTHSPPTPIPGGQFDPIGITKPYRPDPSL